VGRQCTARWREEYRGRGKGKIGTREEGRRENKM